MGYTISVNCIDKKIQNKMMKFINANELRWKKICKHLGSQRISFPRKENLSYSPKQKKFLIGIDYGAISGSERVFAYSFIRWLSSIVEKRKGYYFYDYQRQRIKDDEYWEGEIDRFGVPLKIVSRIPNTKNFIDRSKEWYWEIEYLKIDPKEQLEYIRKEMMEFDRLWKKSL